MSDVQKFARNLRFAYESRGLTQQQVADAAGITVPHLSRILNGQVPNVSVCVCSKLAAAVDADLPELFATPGDFMLHYSEKTAA